MLNSRVKQAVEQTTPGKRVSLILTVRPKDLEKISTIEDIDERITKLKKIYKLKKDPILKHFVVYEKSGLRINSLVGTPSVIVTAPARVWRRVIREQHKMFTDPSVEVSTNELDFFSA